VNGGLLSQIEVPLYGSSRLGVWRPDREVETTGWELFDTDPMTGTGGGIAGGWERGRVQFELSNHLGNVLVTISDVRIPVLMPEGIELCDDPVHPACYRPIDYYLPQVLTANDYYPFGMIMPGRKYSEGNYRYGFNGKEKDNDINSLTAYDYGFRIYNPAIGRFLSVDPLTKSYPWYTPYQFAGNKPILCVDLDGLEDCEYLVAWWYPSIATDASKLLLNNPSDYLIKRQQAWNAVISKIDAAVPKYFDSKHNLNGVVWEGGLLDEVLGDILSSHETGVFNSYYNYLNKPGDYEDINPLLTQAASDLANDHYRASMNGQEFYNSYINAINIAKDPNAKAILIEERGRIAAERVYAFREALLVGAQSMLDMYSFGKFSGTPGVRPSKYTIYSTRTVWDDITPTQANYESTALPQSFELNTGNGFKIWVHGNATKHMAEYLYAGKYVLSRDGMGMTAQMELTSLKAAVQSATSKGIKYGELLIEGGWELKFGLPRNPGDLPVLIHALKRN
jgi:RHS repeat-associated protein